MGRRKSEDKSEDLPFLIFFCRKLARTSEKILKNLWQETIERLYIIRVAEWVYPGTGKFKNIFFRVKLFSRFFRQDVLEILTVKRARIDEF